MTCSMLHIPAFSRPVKSRPWIDFLLINGVCPTFAYAPLAGCITVGFGLGFVVGWNYHIPTHAESLLWRMCSVYHAVFSIFRELYYGFGMMKCNKPCSQSTQFPEQEPSSEEGRRQHTRYLRDTPILRSLLRKWDNTLPDQDPILRNPLCVLVPVTIICAIYILCRLYLYAEDFASLREQLRGVYISTDLFHW